MNQSVCQLMWLIHLFWPKSSGESSSRGINEWVNTSSEEFGWSLSLSLLGAACRPPELGEPADIERDDIRVSALGHVTNRGLGAVHWAVATHQSNSKQHTQWVASTHTGWALFVPSTQMHQSFTITTLTVWDVIWWSWTALIPQQVSSVSQRTTTKSVECLLFSVVNLIYYVQTYSMLHFLLLHFRLFIIM